MPLARPALRLIALIAALLPGAAMADITVFAAASLKTALDRIAADWQAQTGVAVTVSYDSSAKLAKQIQQGAEADLFLSASSQWMDAVEQDGLIRPETRRALLGNRLILIAPGQAAPPIAIQPGFDLLGRLAGGKLAMGLVDSVPAGQYGKEALSTLGVWDAVAPQVAQADNVRAALRLVEQGEAALGIVYASDAVADDAVSVIGTFPDSSHAPIVYPAAVTTLSPGTEAQAFLDALSAPRAAQVFTDLGFIVLPPGSDG